MDSASSQFKICTLTSKLGFPSPPPKISLPVQQTQLKKLGSRIKCAKEAVAGDKWIEIEVNVEEELKWYEKCQGREGGIVEALECLEREAIMGDDQGREAIDYNRRALIFDKSARVFQALKQQNTSSAV